MKALPHAILIEGGSESLRFEKAVSLLKEHFMDDPHSEEKLDKGVFEDLILVEPDEGKDITVSKVEELIALFKQKPFASTGKACIVPAAERMNEYAQNKMLKLLEEPAAGDVIILLAANAQMLLPTVRSRTMRVWLGYEVLPEGAWKDEFRTLTSVLVYGKGALADANGIFSRYEGSREDAVRMLSAFQIFLRAIAVGRHASELMGGTEFLQAGDGKYIADAAAKVKNIYAERMRSCVLLAEKAQADIERGDRVRNVLRGIALTMRMEQA